jgi:hypothetical protein
MRWSPRFDAERHDQNRKTTVRVRRSAAAQPLVSEFALKFLAIRRAAFRLAFFTRRLHRFSMGCPSGSVTLTIEQISEMNKRLSALRHDINGDLALIVASAELVKLNPASAPQRLKMLLEQPEKIRKKMDDFSAELEKALGIVR